MKKIYSQAIMVFTIFVIAGLVFVGFTSNIAADGLRIGYADVATIFDSYERTKGSDKKLESEGKQKESELTGRVEQLKKLRQELELLSDEARDKKQLEIEERSDALKRFRSQTARDLRRERDDIAKKIFKDIDKTIEGYAKENGFSLILDRRSILYATSKEDVTKPVLESLNREYRENK